MSERVFTAKCGCATDGARCAEFVAAEAAIEAYSAEHHGPTMTNAELMHAARLDQVLHLHRSASMNDWEMAGW